MKVRDSKKEEKGGGKDGRYLWTTTILSLSLSFGVQFSGSFLPNKAQEKPNLPDA
jgi:hypothetical protein